VANSFEQRNENLGVREGEESLDKLSD